MRSFGLVSTTILTIALSPLSASARTDKPETRPSRHVKRRSKVPGKRKKTHPAPIRRKVRTHKGSTRAKQPAARPVILPCPKGFIKDRNNFCRLHARACKRGWHWVPGGYCVRDTCPLGWHRDAGRRCRPRRCSQGFVMSPGRMCVPARCPWGLLRARTSQCLPRGRMRRCGTGFFRNPHGRCVPVVLALQVTDPPRSCRQGRVFDGKSRRCIPSRTRNQRQAQSPTKIRKRRRLVSRDRTLGRNRPGRTFTRKRRPSHASRKPARGPKGGQAAYRPASRARKRAVYARIRKQARRQRSSRQKSDVALR